MTFNCFYDKIVVIDKQKRADIVSYNFCFCFDFSSHRNWDARLSVSKFNYYVNLAANASNARNFAFLMKVEQICSPAYQKVIKLFLGNLFNGNTKLRDRSNKD